MACTQRIRVAAICAILANLTLVLYGSLLAVVWLKPLIKQANGDSYDEIDYSDNPRLTLLLWWFIRCLLLGLTVSHAMMIFLLIVPAALLLAPKDLNHHVPVPHANQEAPTIITNAVQRRVAADSTSELSASATLTLSFLRMGSVGLAMAGLVITLAALGCLQCFSLLKDEEEMKEDTVLMLLLIRSIVLGSLIFLLAALSLMISFWPAVTSSSSSTTTTDAATLQSYASATFFSHPDGSHEASSLTEPLLPPANHPDNDEEQQQCPTEGPTSIGELLDTTANVIDTTEASQTNAEPTDPASTSTNTTSRSRGTRRLLSLAAPEVLYLYAGCTVLLLRLPFSLSIPHFVSTTLTAVTRGQFASAHAEILALLGAGTMDAILDFWCVFLFGLANQRIVKTVRLSLFQHVIRQEVAFFDSTSSSELASRLQSDCSEMASD